MALPPSLSETPTLLIADTSVVINLNATGCAEEILALRISALRNNVWK